MYTTALLYLGGGLLFEVEPGEELAVGPLDKAATSPLALEQQVLHG